MLPQLTLSCLISADGKTATRSGESLLSSASPQYLERLAKQRQAAECLLVEASSPIFEIPRNTALIVVGNSSTWQPVVNSLPPDKVRAFNEVEQITAATLRTAANALKVRNIHCTPSAHLSRRILKEEAVDILILCVLFSLSGGQSADTMTGYGSASAFACSRQFTLISHELSDNDMYLCYQSASHPMTTLSAIKS